MSGNPIINSIQLSITLALIFRKMFSDLVTSLKRFKSNTTVSAKPTTDVGMSCLLILWPVAPDITSCCCYNHFATSLLTKEVYTPVSNKASAVKYIGEENTLECMRNSTTS